MGVKRLEVRHREGRSLEGRPRRRERVGIGRIARCEVSREEGSPSVALSNGGERVEEERRVAIDCVEPAVGDRLVGGAERIAPQRWLEAAAQRLDQHREPDCVQLSDARERARDAREHDRVGRSCAQWRGHRFHAARGHPLELRSDRSARELAKRPAAHPEAGVSSAVAVRPGERIGVVQRLDPRGDDTRRDLFAMPAKAEAEQTREITASSSASVGVRASAERAGGKSVAADQAPCRMRSRGADGSRRSRV